MSLLASIALGIIGDIAVEKAGDFLSGLGGAGDRGDPSGSVGAGFAAPAFSPSIPGPSDPFGGVDGGGDTASLFEEPGGLDTRNFAQPIIEPGGGTMSLLGTIVGATRDVLVARAGAGASRARFAPSQALVAQPALLGIPGLGGGAKKRRRSRARITSRELNELFMLKTVFGSRSPVLTLAGIKMLGRGG